MRHTMSRLGILAEITRRQDTLKSIIEEDKVEASILVIQEEEAMGELKEFLSHTFSMEPWFTDDEKVLREVKNEIDTNLDRWKRGIEATLNKGGKIPAMAINYYHKYRRMRELYYKHCTSSSPLVDAESNLSSPLPLFEVLGPTDSHNRFCPFPLDRYSNFNKNKGRVMELGPAQVQSSLFTPVKELIPAKDMGEQPDKIDF